MKSHLVSYSLILRHVCLGCVVVVTALAGCGNDASGGDSGDEEVSSNVIQDTSDSADNTSLNSDSATTGTSQGGTDSSSDAAGWEGDSDSTVVVGDDGELITDGDGEQFVCYETYCDGRLLACGDCVDNDSDNKTDWRDPECLGPCDNTEGAALISGVGGVTGSTCHVDCYFDYGNGMGTGSDDCWWDHQCDALEPEPLLCEYDESKVDNQRFCPSTQSDLCSDVCLPYTPNGCDCFGCCTFPELASADSGDPAYVWIGAKNADNVGTCTFEDILDTSRCPRCTPVSNCLNECGECEICIGKPTVPDHCYTTDSDDTDGTNLGQCSDGIEACDINDASPCPSGYYCISGCCQSIDIS